MIHNLKKKKNVSDEVDRNQKKEDIRFSFAFLLNYHQYVLLCDKLGLQTSPWYDCNGPIYQDFH